MEVMNIAAARAHIGAVIRALKKVDNLFKKYQRADTFVALTAQQQANKMAEVTPLAALANARYEAAKAVFQSDVQEPMPEEE